VILHVLLQLSAENNKEGSQGGQVGGSVIQSVFQNKLLQQSSYTAQNAQSNNAGVKASDVNMQQTPSAPI